MSPQLKSITDAIHREQKALAAIPKEYAARRAQQKRYICELLKRQAELYQLERDR